VETIDTAREDIACWINKATNIQSEYVILIAFPLQQWLQEGALMLHYTCIACLVLFCFDNVVHCKGKGKAVPLQAWNGPEGFQEVKVPRFHGNGTGWW
jgi:hypothetical protein